VKLWFVLLTLMFTAAAFQPQEKRPYSSAVQQFKNQTGYPNGRKGFVVDHQLPLCLGGPDAVTNMAWEPVAESYVKDKYERRMCLSAAKQGYRLTKVPPA
jgi:hypothetical protein